ncbi:MAG TPA: GTPase domain-containing protein [Kofleriaceae bacterium]|nr:GTPase domain-containing protein [Kofleriaceae bacterium]
MISVVYDGPPEAGKTTTVRALARGFGREVYTPEERDGRTVHFDWLEHVGGRFEGSPIRCQIVSVPGQKRWVRRRAHFLERADVVVFVGDTTASAWPETVARLADLRADLDARQGPPVGLVFQANKRDCADAVPLDEIRARAANARTAVVESSAPDGTGVREAFVFAVRLALDRVRDLHRFDPVRAASRPRAGFGAEGVELYDLLRRLDVDADRAGASPGERAGTRPPSHDAPCGFVWPPIEGRILLRDAAPPAGSPVDVGPAGDCHAAANSGWIVHSGAGAVFVDLDDARAVLIDWARQHAAAQSVLSRRRCIVLAETGDGRWRLWQIVRREASLRQLTGVAPALAERMLGEASAACAQAAPSLPVTLDTIGAELERPIYVGLMPAPVGRAERR